MNSIVAVRRESVPFGVDSPIIVFPSLLNVIQFGTLVIMMLGISMLLVKCISNVPPSHPKFIGSVGKSHSRSALSAIICHFFVFIRYVQPPVSYLEYPVGRYSVPPDLIL